MNASTAKTYIFMVSVCGVHNAIAQYNFGIEVVDENITMFHMTVL
jgi:hypothetical protein